jgi:hypothetical protein
MISGADLIRRQRKILEDLFSTEWLNGRRFEHPARSRWSLCTEILKQGGTIRWPKQREDLPELAALLLDSVSFVTISEGSLHDLRLGDITGYGGDSVQRKIESRLPDPRQFDALMLELSMAAWHQSKGHHIRPMEKEGLPDLRVSLPDIEFPVYVECKRLTTSSKWGIQKRIRLANKQLRAVDEESYGVMILDISGSVGPVESISDEMPARVKTIIGYAEQAISGPKNRSVSRVIVSWDDTDIMGEPPARTSVFLRRNTRHLEHEPVEGVTQLRLGNHLFQGNTVFFCLTWDTSLMDVIRLRFSDLMRECQKWFDFSNDELLAAYEKRDKSEPIRLDDETEFVLFSRKAEWQSQDVHILVCARKEGKTLNILFAFRIPPQIHGIVDLLTPLEMLATFAEHYGLPVAVGGHVQKFIFRRDFKFPSDPLGVQLGAVRNPQDHSCVQSMMVRVSRDNGWVLVSCALVFAIDITLVLSDLGYDSPRS